MRDDDEYGDDDDDDDDDDDEDDDDEWQEGREYDRVKFPPYPYIMIGIMMRGVGGCGQTQRVEPLRHSSDIISRPSTTPKELPTKWQ